MNITFLSGLPRTGSTVLTSILNQNEEIYAGPNSALCQLMWDMQVSCWNTEQIKNSPHIEERLISEIPNIFYRGINKNIVDKCRSWTLPANLELIDRYVTKTPKIIVMLRPIVDIVKSFVFVRKMNGWKNPEFNLLEEGSEPIMRSLEGVIYAKENNNGQFIFIEYDDLVNYPKETMKKIYDFCEWEPFNHDFKNIENKFIENDEYLNLIGLHDIRKEVGKRKINVRISDELYSKAIKIRY